MAIPSLNRVRYRRLLFSVNDTFLDAGSGPGADINYYIQSPVNVNGALSEFHTLLIDLGQGSEAIWQKIYHRTRSEISSFLSNQRFEHRVLYQPGTAELDELIRLFNRFAQYRNIRKAEAFRLKAYNRAGLLAVSYIKQDGHFLCVNFYRLNTQRATNLYSFSLQHQLGNAFNQSHLGRAHRALHWLDVVEFKKQGVAFYDFCGWYHGNEDKALLNINKFKEQFTNHKVVEYSGVIYTNKLLLFLLKLKR